MVCNRKEIPTDPRPINEAYSCNDADRDYMMNNCHICYSHGLAKVNLNHENSESSDTSVNESDLEPNLPLV